MKKAGKQLSLFIGLLYAEPEHLLHSSAGIP